MRVFILTFLLINCLLPSTQATNIDSLYVTPNPFDTATIIHFKISEPDTVTLELTDLLGTIVKTFYEKTALKSGSYTINYNTDTLPVGMYMLSLRLNSESIAIRLLRNNTVLGLQNQRADKTKTNIFPNPTSGILNIEYKGLKSVFLTDLNGKIIYQNQTQENIINISTVEAGVYILHVYTSDKKLISNQKIVLTE